MAVLLTCLKQPAQIKERAALATVLAEQDAEQLRGLLLRLARRGPDFEEAIEAEAASLASRHATGPAMDGPGTGRITVDAKAIGRAVRSTLHSLDRLRPSEAYWQVGGVVEGVREILDRAGERLDVGDAPGALAILEAVTESYMQEWETLDDSDGEAGAFFEDLGQAWTEALLTLDLAPSEGEVWASRLMAWAEELEVDYGVGEALNAAAAAASARWDNPALQAVLRGTTTDDLRALAAFAAEPVELTLVRLRVLERQGRFDEYLRLAQAASQTVAYTAMLVQLGRVDEAVAYGLKHLKGPAGAFELAQRLRERGASQAALDVAEHGTTLPGRKADLATWLCELARSVHQPERALRAALIAFREDPGLSAYLAVRELSGLGWDSLREELLAHIRGQKSPLPAGSVEIFLHEGLIDEAITAVRGSWDYRLIEEVALAAVETHPEWVIEASRGQAESIMNAGKADLYHAAVRWLGHARAAYRAASLEEAWQAYLSELVIRHARKHKLRPMLDALRR